MQKWVLHDYASIAKQRCWQNASMLQKELIIALGLYRLRGISSLNYKNVILTLYMLTINLVDFLEI